MKMKKDLSRSPSKFDSVWKSQVIALRVCANHTLGFFEDSIKYYQVQTSPSNKFNGLLLLTTILISSDYCKDC